MRCWRYTDSGIKRSGVLLSVGEVPIRQTFFMEDGAVPCFHHKGRHKETWRR